MVVLSEEILTNFAKKEEEVHEHILKRMKEQPPRVLDSLPGRDQAIAHQKMLITVSSHHYGNTAANQIQFSQVCQQIRAARVVLFGADIFSKEDLAAERAILESLVLTEQVCIASTFGDFCKMGFHQGLSLDKMLYETALPEAEKKRLQQATKSMQKNHDGTFYFLDNKTGKRDDRDCVLDVYALGLKRQRTLDEGKELLAPYERMAQIAQTASDILLKKVNSKLFIFTNNLLAQAGRREFFTRALERKISNQRVIAVSYDPERILVARNKDPDQGTYELQSGNIKAEFVHITLEKMLVWIEETTKPEKSLPTQEVVRVIDESPAEALLLSAREATAPKGSSHNPLTSAAPSSPNTLTAPRAVSPAHTSALSSEGAGSDKTTALKNLVPSPKNGEAANPSLHRETVPAPFKAPTASDSSESGQPTTKDLETSLKDKEKPKRKFKGSCDQRFFDPYTMIISFAKEQEARLQEPAQEYDTLISKGMLETALLAQTTEILPWKQSKAYALVKDHEEGALAEKQRLTALLQGLGNRNDQLTTLARENYRNSIEGGEKILEHVRAEQELYEKKQRELGNFQKFNIRAPTDIWLSAYTQEGAENVYLLTPFVELTKSALSTQILDFLTSIGAAHTSSKEGLVQLVLDEKKFSDFMNAVKTKKLTQPWHNLGYHIRITKTTIDAEVCAAFTRKPENAAVVEYPSAKENTTPGYAEWYETHRSACAYLPTPAEIREELTKSGRCFRSTAINIGMIICYLNGNAAQPVGKIAKALSSDQTGFGALQQLFSKAKLESKYSSFFVFEKIEGKDNVRLTSQLLQKVKSES